MSNHTFACFDCRTAVKSPAWPRNTVLCPRCGKVSTWMGQSFKTPKQRDKRAWERIRKLRLEDGMIFNKDAGPVPLTNYETRRFLRKRRRFREGRPRSGIDWWDQIRHRRNIY